MHKVVLGSNIHVDALYAINSMLAASVYLHLPETANTVNCNQSSYLKVSQTIFGGFRIFIASFPENLIRTVREEHSFKNKGHVKKGCALDMC